MRILIAEDDARLLKSLLHIFKKNQFIVDGVSNGNDALDYALTNNYDGLVLDVMMPGLDGVEASQKTEYRYACNVSDCKDRSISAC